MASVFPPSIDRDDALATTTHGSWNYSWINAFVVGIGTQGNGKVAVCTVVGRSAARSHIARRKMNLLVNAILQYIMKSIVNKCPTGEMFRVARAVCALARVGVR